MLRWNSSARLSDIVRILASFVAVTRNIKFSKSLWKRGLAPEPQIRTSVTTRWTQQKVFHWSAVNLPAFASPTFVGTVASHLGNVVLFMSE